MVQKHQSNGDDYFGKTLKKINHKFVSGNSDSSNLSQDGHTTILFLEV